ncbi:MAG: HU family DNA-binding protein [Bacilli bacterium]|jgi:DNA-binding protein HU-beta|nr:HU family DNA-binding protein [Bacilli bacterium]
MNIVELAAKVSEQCQLTKTDAENIVRVVFADVVDALKAGDKVKIAGFGSFEVKERAARKGLNPATKTSIEIPASKSVGFKVSKGVKEVL